MSAVLRRVSTRSPERGLHIRAVPVTPPVRLRDAIRQPSPDPVKAADMTTIVDLSHPIHAGLQTHPGLPAPTSTPFRTREDYRAASGTDFQVDQVTMVGNTGTYLDSPFHRFADGGDLASLPLESVVDLATFVLDVRRDRAVNTQCLTQLQHEDLTGAAVLLHTGGDREWGTEAYAEQAPYLTVDGARWLAKRGPALVGIDSVNIDDLDDPSRPAHTSLLGAGVLVLEHLSALADLPARGARLHAAPPAWRGVGTWPVRAYALIDGASR
jgi:arylformamidase